MAESISQRDYLVSDLWTERIFPSSIAARKTDATARRQAA
jgi:hypothetical protein